MMCDELSRRVQARVKFKSTFVALHNQSLSTGQKVGSAVTPGEEDARQPHRSDA